METATPDYKNAKGWLLDEERELLYRLASEVKPYGRILNIGTEYGASVACLRAGNATAILHTVDLDLSKLLGSYDCHLHEIDSAKLFNFWKDSLDLIFVDGDHGYEGVLLDARFAQWLPIGGYILFQDCYDHVEIGKIHALVPGVNAAVSDWFSQHSKEFEELPYVGSTRVFKRIANAA